MTSEPPEVSSYGAPAKIDLAGPVSDRVQIQHVLLAETVAKRKASCSGPPASLSLDVHVATEVKKDIRIIQVCPRFILIGRASDQDQEELLRIEALFVLHYEVPGFEGLTNANIAAFGELNGLYNAWPYWREFVQSMTVRMGLPPLTMPVFRPLAGGIVARRARRAGTHGAKRDVTAGE
jgi:hypothetical protein